MRTRDCVQFLVPHFTNHHCFVARTETHNDDDNTKLLKTFSNRTNSVSFKYLLKALSRHVCMRAYARETKTRRVFFKNGSFSNEFHIDDVVININLNQTVFYVRFFFLVLLLRLSSRRTNIAWLAVKDAAWVGKDKAHLPNNDNKRAKGSSLLPASIGLFHVWYSNWTAHEWRPTISDYILRIPARGLRCWRMITGALNSMPNQTFDRIPYTSFVHSFFLFCFLFSLCQKMIRFHYLSLGQWSCPFFSFTEKHFVCWKKNTLSLYSGQ